MAEEFTARFKVDISDLKKNITEANKEIKLANATFKAETAGMDKWSKDADGLSSKLKQLKKVLEGQKTILEAYKKQLDAQRKAYDENGKRAEELEKKLHFVPERIGAETLEEVCGVADSAVRRGSLETRRSICKTGDTEICLDKNTYLGVTDYEIELEYTGEYPKQTSMVIMISRQIFLAVIIKHPP